MGEKIHIDIKEVKKLALRFTPEQLDACINQQISQGSNVCDVSGTTDEVVNELSKAEYVRQLMEQGVSLTDAVRILASKIRSFHHTNE